MRTLRLVGLAILLLFCAISPAAADYASSAAVTIPLNGSASGNVVEGQNDYWWDITVPSDGRLVIETFSAGNLELMLYLFEKNGTVQIKNYEGGWGTHTTLIYDNIMPGTYQVRVSRWNNYGAYTIKSTFTESALPIETEPNDTLNQAVNLPVNASDTAHLGYYGNGYTDNTDWWKITVPSDGRLLVETRSAEEPLAILMYLYDQNKETQIKSYNGGWGNYTTLNYDNLLPGTYYVKVDRWQSFGSYTITATFTPASLAIEAEPNDSLAVAVDLPANGSDTAHIGFYGNGYTDNTDWWKITVPSDGALLVETQGSPADPDLALLLYLYDQNRETQIRGYNGGWGNHTTLNYDNLMPGTYYVKVDRWQSFGSYTIKSMFQATSLAIEPEPNDSLAVAATLDPNGSDTAHLGFYGNGYTDVTDWWKITVPSDGALFVEVTSALPDSNLATLTYLYDQNKETQIKGYNGGWGKYTTLNYDNLLPGTYYLKVDRWTSFGSYTIKSTFTPTSYAIEQESNDTPDHAATLKPNASATAHLGFYGNGYTDTTDWWVITTPSDGRLVVESVVATPDSNLATMLYLFDNDGTTQIKGYEGGWGRHTTLIYDNLAAGTYRVKTDRWTNFGSYRITSTFTPNHYYSEREPNDTRETAVTASVNTGTTGHIGYYGNGRFDGADYFSFTVPSGWDSLFIRVQPDQTLNPYLHLLNSDGNEIASFWAPTYIMANPAPGTYYLYLSHWTGYGGYAFIAQKDWRDDVPVTAIPTNLEPPANLSLADVPNDNGHTARLTWTPSLSESTGSVSWYRIFRSRMSAFTDPIPLTRFAKIDSLLFWEERATILIDSVAAGTTQYTDSAVPLNGVKYYYWMQAVGSGGVSKIAGMDGGIVTSVAETAQTAAPLAFRVDQPYPNPFNPAATIRYQIPVDAQVRIVVYDALGRKVAVVTESLMRAGTHEAVWNGRSETGGMAASGVYIYRIEAGQYAAQGKMTMIR